MAITTIKSTYALDVASVRALEGLATRWQVSKSEALRRAIHGASVTHDVPGGALALDALQEDLGLTEAQARRWAERTRARRHAVAPRRPRRKA